MSAGMRRALPPWAVTEALGDCFYVPAWASWLAHLPELDGEAVLVRRIGAVLAVPGAIDALEAIANAGGAPSLEEADGRIRAYVDSLPRPVIA